MDDFTPNGDAFETTLVNLEKVLERCVQTNVALSTEKCHMMMTEGIVLGHYIFIDGIKVDPAKMEVILRIPTPKTQKEVRSFLGHARYYKRFIDFFSRIASPLFSLLMKDVDFLWIRKCEQAFLKLRRCVLAAPVLRGPNWELPFHIAMDASDIAVGAVLGQLEDKKPYAIYYISKNLTPAELNYTMTEKEFLAVVHTINKFWLYITGYQVFVHTDHSAISFLMNKPITNGRISHWLLLLQEFDITIVDNPGKDNVVADFLSRLTIDDNCTPTEDSFPDEYLFAISTYSLWYADIANYLAAGKFPQYLSSKEKRKIIQQSATYTWIDGNLYHTGPDFQIRCCVREDKVFDILKACHEEPCGGHFADKRTGYKVLSTWYLLILGMFYA